MIGPIFLGVIVALGVSFWWGLKWGSAQGKKSGAEAERLEIIGYFRHALDPEDGSQAARTIDKALASKWSQEAAKLLADAGKWQGMEVQGNLNRAAEGEGDIRMAKKDFWYISWLADCGFRVWITPIDNPFRTGGPFTEAQAGHACRILEAFEQDISLLQPPETAEEKDTRLSRGENRAHTMWSIYQRFHPAAQQQTDDPAAGSAP